MKGELARFEEHDGPTICRLAYRRQLKLLRRRRVSYAQMAARRHCYATKFRRS